MRDKLIFWFIENYPDYYEDMLNSKHYADKFVPNPYHAEGSIWTHTMMVMTYAEAKFKNDNYYIELITTALLHDIGKPEAEEIKPANDIKPARNSFHGHEGISTMRSIDVLKKLQEDFPEVYTNERIKLILRMISLHGVHIDGRNDLLQKFRECDKGGAIRRDNEVQEQYPPRKYVKETEKNPGRELVLLCGLPCSGKSTYINSLKGYEILSRDDEMHNFLFIEKRYVKTQFNSSYNNVYKLIHEDEDVLKEFNQFFEDKIRELSKKDKVVVDMTMMSLKSRRTMLSKFPKHTAKAVVMMTSLEEIKSRNKNREGKFISDNVFEMMMKSFVMPVKKEGFEEIELILD